MLVQACTRKQFKIGVTVDARRLYIAKAGKGTACLTSHAQHTLGDVIDTVSLHSGICALIIRHQRIAT